MASKANNADEIASNAVQLRMELEKATCTDPSVGKRLINASDALVSFARTNDKEGVKQATDMIYRDLRIPQIGGTFVRPKPSRGYAAPLRRPQAGYSFRINGKEEIKFVPKDKGFAFFDAATRLHPDDRVELVPMEKPVARPSPPPTFVFKGALTEKSPLESTPFGSGYIERTKDASGKVTRITVKDASGAQVAELQAGPSDSLE